MNNIINKTKIENATFIDLFNRFVFYYEKYSTDDRKLGAWASSDRWVYIGIVFAFHFFRISFWIQRDSLNPFWKDIKIERDQHE